MGSAIPLERQGLFLGILSIFVSEKLSFTNFIAFLEEVTKRIDEGSAVDTLHGF